MRARPAVPIAWWAAYISAGSGLSLIFTLSLGAHATPVLAARIGGQAVGQMALLLGDLPWAEQVELDSAGDAGDAGLARLAGGEVPGFLGFPRAGPVRAAADVEGGHEDLQQERGERVL